jgi:hypothetical protein
MGRVVDGWRRTASKLSLPPTVDTDVATYLLLAACVLAPGSLQAAESDRVGLATRVRERVGHASIPDPAEIEAAKKRLAQTAAQLNNYLTRQGKNGTAWKRYLRLDELISAPRAEGQVPDDALRQILSRFRSDFSGLERPVCLNVAMALEDYLRIAGQPARSVTSAEVDDKLQELAKSLETLADPPSPGQIEAISDFLGWLNDRGIESRLVAEIRAQLSQPNLHVHVSQDLIGVGSLRQISDAPRPVRDVILGTNIYGTGRTTGWVRTRLLPDPTHTLFETAITATNRAQTVGYNGPARIASNSTTHLSGTKRFYFDPTGIYVWRASSCADAHSQLCGVWSNKHGLRDRIVRRVASRRAGQQKAAAEQVAARHAEQQLNARLDAEANAQLARAHTGFLTKVRYPLLRLGQWPRELRMASTADRLQIVALHDGGSQLASLSAPPAVPEQATMAVQVHESMVNNYSDGLLSGRTLVQKDLDKLSLQLFGRRPPQLTSDEERGPWSMTFASERPVTLRVDDGRASLTIRGRRFGSVDRTVDTPLDVVAHYRLVRENGAAKAIREGDNIEVYPTGFVPGGGRRVSLRESRDASFVRNRFDDFFTPEITSQGLILPGQWSQAGRLELVELAAERGWITLAWRRPGDDRTKTD